MVPFSRAEKPPGECARSMRPLRGALLISIAGHLLLVSGWRMPTRPATSSVGPVLVRLDARPAARPLPQPPSPPIPPRSSSNRAHSEHITTPDSPQSRRASADDSLFLPPSSLDQPALPKSGPTIEALDDMPITGMVIRLRLYIDEAGVVQRVEPLTFAPDDEAAVRQLAQVFKHTTFLAGQRQGQYVRSYLDIEITPNPLR